MTRLGLNQPDGSTSDGGALIAATEVRESACTYLAPTTFRPVGRAAVAAGMKVNAGHDLDLRNMPLVAREIPEIDEVSIGHALLSDALYLGLAEAVRRYARVCRGEAVDAPVTK